MNCRNCNCYLTDHDQEMNEGSAFHSICAECDHVIWDLLDNTSATIPCIDLYLELKAKNIAVEIEKNDGFKTVDISIPSAKINIEIDGNHHSKADQALRDLMRTMFDWKKGITTLHIPNDLIHQKLPKVVSIIHEMVLHTNPSKG